LDNFAKKRWQENRQGAKLPKLAQPSQVHHVFHMPQRSRIIFAKVALRVSMHAVQKLVHLISLRQAAPLDKHANLLEKVHSVVFAGKRWAFWKNATKPHSSAKRDYFVVATQCKMVHSKVDATKSVE
jgi:hypothetical protein